VPKVVRVIARLNVGGPAIHVILLADRLRPAYETVLVSGIETPREGNMLPLARRLGVDVVRVAELGREINVLGDLVALLKLIRLIAREKPEIVHTHTAKAGLVGRLAAWLCRTPVVVHTFHGHVFRGYFGPVKTGLFLTLERLLARLTDQVLTVNDQQRSELIAFGVAPSNKIRAMLLGLDLGELASGQGDAEAMRRTWGVPPEAPLVGIVARLVPVKGHELFLDAAADLHARRPDARFVVVGDGERRAELEAYAAALGVPVVFAGWESDLPAVYAALDVVCLTSLNEGSPVALIEAMAAGKPVVSTPAGGVVDLIQDGENGVIVGERDAAQFSRAIQRLLEDRDLAAALGARGRASVYPRYDVSRLAADISALYGELLARR
jgi:glycosyltransferase involved in cell wall biosynthesis